jgi:hypothetical protein
MTAHRGDQRINVFGASYALDVQTEGIYAF